MTAKVINLRTARKQKARDTRAEKVARETAAQSGVGKGERTRVRTLSEQEARKLDGHRREPTDET